MSSVEMGTVKGNVIIVLQVIWCVATIPLLVDCLFSITCLAFPPCRDVHSQNFAIIRHDMTVFANYVYFV